MKKYILAGLFVGVGIGAAFAAESLTFVTTLSAPVASFNKVETMVDNAVQISSDARINAGNKKSTGGSINLQGGPMSVKTLYMEDKTALSATQYNGNDVKWMLNELNIHRNGSVEVTSLLARDIWLKNSKSGYSTKLQANNSMQLDNTVQALSGGANFGLMVCGGGDCSTDPRFNFVAPSSMSSITATPKVLSKSTPEASVSSFEVKGGGSVALEKCLVIYN